MGEVVNLVLAWEPFKAAKSALSNTIENSNVEFAATRAGDQLRVRLLNHTKNCKTPVYKIR